MSRMVDQDGTTLELDAATTEVAAARRFVRTAVAGRVPDVVSANLQLIVSELFTNAVQYGDAGTVSVTVEVTNVAAIVVVDSASPAPSVGPVSTWAVAEEDEVTGRGLGIVREVADDVRVDRAGGRFAVTARCGLGDD